MSSRTFSSIINLVIRTSEIVNSFIRGACVVPHFTVAISAIYQSVKYTPFTVFLFRSPTLCFWNKLLIYYPYPQTPSPWEGAILLGLPPLDQARMLAVSHTKPLHDAVAQMADDLYGGSAPKQGRFGCLPKVLHDAKPAKQATLDTPFFR